MARPYSKKTKKDAVAICTFGASNQSLPFADIIAGMGVKRSSTGAQLALAATYAIRRILLETPRDEIFAEAAALIRSGWLIGDEIDWRSPYYGINRSVGVPLQYSTQPQEDSFVDEAKNYGKEEFIRLVNSEFAEACKPDGIETVLRSYANLIKPPCTAVISDVESFVSDSTEPSPAGEPGDYGADS